MVGDFFVKSKAAIWTEIKNQERLIGENLKRPEIARLVKFIHEDLFGGQEPLDDINGASGFTPTMKAYGDGRKSWRHKPRSNTNKPRR